MGAATLTLSGANRYRGQLTISAGTLTLADNDTNILPDNSNVVLADTAGAILNINGKSAETIGNLSGGGSSGGNITLGDGGLTVKTRANVTYGGVISGTGSLTKTGFAALTLEGQNTYTGGTTINAGQVKSGVDNALVSTGAVTFGANPAELVVMNTFSQTIGNLTSSSTNSRISLRGSGALTVTQGNDGTYAGLVRGYGALTKAGSAVLTLSNDNTYRGNTTVSAGTLKITGTLDDGNNVVVNGGTYDVDATDTVNSISGSGGTIDVASGVTLTHKSRANKTYAGVVAGAGTLTKLGNSTLTLSGTNTISNLTVSAGRLSVTGTLSDSAAVTINANSFYGVAESDTVGSIAGAGIVDLASGATLSAGNDSNATTFSGRIQGPGNFTKVGSATLTLSGANTYSGQLTISAGTLTLADNDTNILPDNSNIVLADTAGAILNINGKSAETIGNLSGGGSSGGNITLGDGGLTVKTRANVTYGGVISGTGSLTKEGFAALTLEGQNTYTGGTTINAGQVKSGVDNALASTGAVTFGANPAEFIVMNTFSQTIGNLTSSSTNSKISMIGTSTLTVTQTSNGTYAGGLNGDGTFVKEGSSTLILTKANTNKGLTRVNAGKLELGNNSNIGAVTVANIAGASLDVDGGTATIRTLNGGDNSDIDFGTDGTLIVYQNTNGDFEGTFSGQGTLTKRGSGNLGRLGSTIRSGNSSINN